MFFGHIAEVGSSFNFTFQILASFFRFYENMTCGGSAHGWVPLKKDGNET
jgi:hypothetical protein